VTSPCLEVGPGFDMDTVKKEGQPEGGRKVSDKGSIPLTVGPQAVIHVMDPYLATCQHSEEDQGSRIRPTRARTIQGFPRCRKATALEKEACILIRKEPLPQSKRILGCGVSSASILYELSIAMHCWVGLTWLLNGEGQRRPFPTKHLDC